MNFKILNVILFRRSIGGVSGVAGWILRLIFCCLLFYNCHKYIFKYGSTGTSPTYEDTPLFWKILKYILLTVLTLSLYLASRFKQKGKPSWLLIPVFGLLLLFINVANFIFYDQVMFDEVEYIYFLFMLLPILLIEDKIIQNIIDALDQASIATSYFFIVASAYVMGNYFIFDRLPALAYEGGSVRFGGLWDDPNGFGFISVFLLFVNYLKGRIKLSLLLLVCILSTLSISALLLIVVSVFYWGNFYLFRVKKSIMRLVVIGIPMAVVGFYYTWGWILTYIESKSKSIHAHTTVNLKFSVFPLLNGSLQFHESWIFSFFYNYFPVSLIILIFALLLLIKLIFSTKKTIISFYIFIFIIGSFAIPLIYDFPLNFIFLFFLFIYLRTGQDRSLEV